ncbi:MAG: hypothetical protein GY852_03605, partial [bacterium]|nr:hypothetical protein [bacterium]
KLDAYELPNPSGYSYYFPEITKAGKYTSRVYLSLYLSRAKPGRVQFYCHGRAVEAAGGAAELRRELGKKANQRPDGALEVWIGSSEEWEEFGSKIASACSMIADGWKRKKEQQATDLFESVEKPSTASGKE